MKIKYTLLVICIALATVYVPTAASDNRNQTYSLDSLVERIVSSNPEIRSYEAEIAKASGSLLNAQKLQNPELVVDLGRKEASISGHNLGQGLTWEVSIAQTFEYPGRIELREAIAKKQITLAELQLARFKRVLIHKARSNALDLYLAQQNRQAVESIAKKAKSLVDVLSRRESAGTAMRLERKIIEAGALSLKQRAIQLSGDVEKLSVVLNTLGGFEMASRYSITIPGFHKTPRIPDNATLVSEALENNPDLLIKKAELQQQGSKVQLSEHEKNPSFTIRPFYMEEDADGQDRTVGVGFSVPLPIWNDNSGNITIEKAQETQIQASLKTLEREVAGNVNANYAAFALQSSQLSALDSSPVDSLRDAAEEAEKQYELGVIPVSTYLQLQQQYLDVLSHYRSTRTLMLKILSDLEQTTGKPILRESEK